MRVAFGRPRRGAEKIMESYREARVALDLRERLHLDEACGFDDLRVDSVLLELSQDRRRAGRSPTTSSRPLQGDSGGGLLEVAQTYVEAGGNLNEAARRLNMHRNTMLYKLNRISRLLQRDIRDADTQFTVWLAHPAGEPRRDGARWSTATSARAEALSRVGDDRVLGHDRGVRHRVRPEEAGDQAQQPDQRAAEEQHQEPPVRVGQRHPRRGGRRRRRTAAC